MKVFFDENFSPHLSDGLNCFQCGTPKESIEVCHIAKFFYRGIPDDEWIPKVAQMHGVAITQDHEIRRTQYLFQLCQDNHLGIFFFKPPKKTPYAYWNLVEWVMNNWSAIKGLSQTTTKPFAFRISPRGNPELMR
jgi:hypothetical protein